MASCYFDHDILSWIQNLTPTPQWQTSNSASLCLCSSSSSQPSLNLSISKSDSNTLRLAIVANFSLPISLWTSKPIKTNDSKSLDDRQRTILPLLLNFIEDVLRYGSNNHNNNNSSTNKFLKIDSDCFDSFDEIRETFNAAFLTLFFLVCIYEAPTDLRRDCLNSVKNKLVNCQSRRGTKLLVKLLGSNLEEQWVRSINLAVTNWIVELQANKRPCTLKTPSPLFSYSLSTLGMWKIHLYCPLIAMNTESSSGSNNNNNSSNSANDDQKLRFSLDYHQLEGVIQLNYRVVPHEMWVGVIVNIDNLRCDVIKLVNETLLSERGVGSSEKHFPSRISLQLTPIVQSNILSVSVGKSSENPVREIGTERTVEAGFEPSNPYYLGLKVTAGETVTVSLKPWKFEESVHGYSAGLNWYLHDSGDGREVFNSRPSKFSLMNPRAWFRQRYSSAYRPFTRQGGVVFAGDEYGESVVWKVDKAAIGRTMEWEIKGWVWLTYWPNKYRTFFTETKRLEFREVLTLTL